MSEFCLWIGEGRVKEFLVYKVMIRMEVLKNTIPVNLKHTRFAPSANVKPL